MIIYLVLFSASMAWMAHMFLSFKALQEFGFFRAWIYPFEEVLYCVKHWPKAKFAAKLYLVSILIMLVGLAILDV